MEVGKVAGQAARGGTASLTPAARQAPKVQVPAPGREDSPSDRGMVLDGVVDEMNRAARVLRTTLRFEVDDRNGELLVKVIDAESGELIRVIPPDRFMEAYLSMQALVGLLLDVRV